MSFSQLQLSKAILPLVMLLSITGQVSAAEAEQADDTAELYQYLFPDAKVRPAAPTRPVADPDALPQAPRAVSGFGAHNRRDSWSNDQVNAMRDAFRRKEPAQVPASVMPQGADSGLYDANPVDLGDQPYANVIQESAAENKVSAHLISSMIQKESGNDPNVISPKGAQGLMQLMPDLSKHYGIDAFDPIANIKTGTKYFAELLAKYQRVDLALAAYNAGPANVDKYGGIPPFPETENYVSSIMAKVAKLEARN